MTIAQPFRVGTRRNRGSSPEGTAEITSTRSARRRRCGASLTRSNVAVSERLAYSHEADRTPIASCFLCARPSSAAESHEHP